MDDGTLLLASDGLDDETSDGLDDGASVGLDDGASVGLDDGASVGLDDGASVGLDDGASDGLDDGCGVVNDGAADGSFFFGQHVGPSSGDLANGEEYMAHLHPKSPHCVPLWQPSSSVYSLQHCIGVMDDGALLLASDGVDDG
jgi:hypothetical protein